MPRPIEPILEDVFYTFYRAPKEAREGEEGVHGPYRIEESGGGFDVVNDLGESKGHHETREQAREQQKALYVNIPEAQEQAKKSNLDNFGDKKAEPFGSKNDDVDDDVDEFLQGGDKERAGGTGGFNDPSEKKSSRRSRLADDRADDYLDDDGVNYDSSGEGHSDAYWNSIADDEDEDKRDKERNSRRKAGIDPSHITIPNYYFVESAAGVTYTDTADLAMATDLADKLAAQKGEEFKVISQQGTVYHTGAGMTYGRRQADTREQMELGLRGDCEACVGTGELYAGEPCPACRGTGNKSGQPDQQPSRGTSWTPPNYQSSRRKKLADDDTPTSGPSFIAPDSMRGGWKCSDCSADDLGVHDLNGHAEAHRQTSHRESAIGLFL